MPPRDRSKRLSALAEIPFLAGLDHRHFLDEQGRDRRLAGLSRHERRKIKAQVRRITEEYRQILLSLLKSGAGYPVDQFIRQLAAEYTNRYAASGIHNQPASFNYFEPFCDIKLIDESVAPYAYPSPEIDHLFSIVDYFDFATGSEGLSFNLAQLKSLPDGKIFHFTPTGNLSDFAFLTAEGREFLVAGFSLIRRGESLHWSVIGGEVYPEAEWNLLVAEYDEADLRDVPPHKRAFIADAIKETGGRAGSPTNLEGTATAQRTIIAGETDLTSLKHISRCCMREWENSFVVISDDPGMFDHVTDHAKKIEMMFAAKERVEAAGVMWHLAESLFQLPLYFSFKVNVARSVTVAGGKKLTAAPKGGRGARGRFRYVSAIEVSEKEPSVIRSYAGPTYQIETEGRWRRLRREDLGRDAHGNSVRGKTWVRETNSWRQASSAPRTIYVKSLIAAAKIKLSEYISRAEGLEVPKLSNGEGVLYVLRCTVMKDEVYKVGWTSGTAEQRAADLSSATGVPLSFAVVASWQHSDPPALEKAVHAMLMPYRINDAREFFEVDYMTIKNVVESEIRRAVSSG